ncbi:MAG: serine/threonine-protein phosphatase [Lachnospiraceae bacterium]|nr:serine/threonine-protein phosphatase [Lachnospiraceae bacterium]
MKRFLQNTSVKSIIGNILMLMLFSVIVILMGQQSFTNALMHQYSEGAFLTASAGTTEINPNRMDQFVKSGGEGSEYRYVWSRLDKLCNSTGSTFVYVIIPDRSDYRHITFIFSTINHQSDYNVYDFGYVRETTNDDYREKYKRICEEGSQEELVIRDKGYIETDPHITAMVPLTGTDGEVKAILCVQRQMEELARLRRNYLEIIVIAMIVLSILVAAGQTRLLRRELLRPLKMISFETQRFSQENTLPEKSLRERISNKDVIGTLAESVDSMEEQIQDYIANLTRVTAETERISTELELAARIQKGMVPEDFPVFPDRHEFTVYASMRPAREVGGDFYDFFLIDRDHLCLVIADVSGKGVPAALFMMVAKTILTNNAMGGNTPSQILKESNIALCAKNTVEMFVTCWIGILEISSGKMVAANAGHEYPLIRKKDGSYEVLKDPHGFVLGGMDGMEYPEYTVTLERGSGIFLYTDGVPEATNTREEMFGLERMTEALKGRGEIEPEENLKHVQVAVDAFVGDAEQFDDMTMMCLEYKGP